MTRVPVSLGSFNRCVVAIFQNTAKFRCPLLQVSIAYIFLVTSPYVYASDWSDSVEVLWNYQPVVTYRAKFDGSFLIVEVHHQPGWHTYAMDNRLRAREKLAGRNSLGIDTPTTIAVSDELEMSGVWYQSPPNDYSKPKLRWFTWGFEGYAVFASAVKKIGAGSVTVEVHGQACDENSCRNIELDLLVPLDRTEGMFSEKFSLEKLTKVRQGNSIQDR